MTDLFAMATPVPAPGSLAPHEERALFQTCRRRWITYAAPNMARKLIAGGEAEIATSWPLMSHAYQTEVWRHLDPDTRRRVYAFVTAPAESSAQEPVSGGAP